MSIAATDELLEAISELRGLFPDWMMGQLVANLVTERPQGRPMPVPSGTSKTHDC